MPTPAKATATSGAVPAGPAPPAATPPLRSPPKPLATAAHPRSAAPTGAGAAPPRDRAAAATAPAGHASARPGHAQLPPSPRQPHPPAAGRRPSQAATPRTLPTAGRKLYPQPCQNDVPKDRTARAGRRQRVGPVTKSPSHCQVRPFYSACMASAGWVGLPARPGFAGRAAARAAIPVEPNRDRIDKVGATNVNAEWPTVPLNRPAFRGYWGRPQGWLGVGWSRAALGMPESPG